MKNLSEKAILYNLKISLWSATKIDKKITREVEQNHNAKDAGRFNKILIAKKGLEDVKSIATSARDFHHKNTLPWGDNGDRLLPSTNYFEYINEQRAFKQKFDDAVQSFIASYPELKSDAQFRLQGMFNESDYPSVEKLRKKFSIILTPMPIAKLDDFRITVNQYEVDHLKAEIERNVYQRINDATRDLWIRIKDAVLHMYERLSDQDAVFHSTLVTNISDLIELLPRLNFTNDYEIARTIEEMKKLIVAPDSLRTNKAKRIETASKAKEILSKINDFIMDDISFQEDVHSVAA